MEDFLKQAFELLLPILGALLTAVSSYAITLITKRLGVKLKEDQERVLRGAIRTGIAGAEEWAARKAKVESRNIKGAEKAIWVHNRLKKLFPELATEELNDLLDEELSQLSQVGATGEKTIQV